jgi:hypothetical protein
MDELNLIVDMVEEQIVKGSLRWLANFNEIRRDYTLGNTRFQLYASGGLEEKGFFLSRIYSTLVTPKYKIHLLVYAADEVDSKSLRSMIIASKSKFGTDDWIFLTVVQRKELAKASRDVISNFEEKTVGIAAYSLESKERIFSNNVLGKGLAKNLKIEGAKFEAFDLPNFLKSFIIVFFLSTSFLVMIALSGLRQAIQPLTLFIMAVFSIIVGYSIYRSRYRTTITLGVEGFELKEGNRSRKGKWSDYDEITTYLTPNRETFLRLHSKKNTFDIPLSRTGLSRKETYNMIKEILEK